jgi:DNA sulfur modification protein DndE
MRALTLASRMSSTVGESLIERALDMTFISDAATAARLRDLVEALGLATENIGARWAICKSLSGGPLDQIEAVVEEVAKGKELKGRTLFGTADIAVVLLGQLLMVEGAEGLERDLRAVVLSHWSRGQRQLDDELRDESGSAESLLVRELDRLSNETQPSDDFATEIVGQPELAARLSSIREAQRGQKRSHPVLICGSPGSGRTYIAGLLARSLGPSVLHVGEAASASAADVGGLLDRHPEANAVIVEGVDLLEPSGREALANLHRRKRVPLIGTAGFDATAPGWEALQILPYERDAVAQILRRRFAWHMEVRRLIALAGRLRPAPTLRRAEDLTLLVETPRISERDAVSAFDLWGLDRLGLDERDIRILSALRHGDRALSTEELAREIQPSVDVDALRWGVLQYLVELRLIDETDHGHWLITSAGAEAYV